MAKGKKKPSKAGQDGERMKRKAYEAEMRKLQVKLCHLQEWVKKKSLRVIIAFEGRDAAGKGGTIRALTERVSPRVFRIVALPAPSERQKSQLFLQRYIEHFPAAGEVVIFDRSWYNRAGVEHVMGFVSEEGYRRFLKLAPKIEKYIVDAGIILIKFWLEVGKEEQERRFHARINDPMRQWKLSPMDTEFIQALVQLLQGARHDARRNRQPGRAVVRGALRRQAARATELHFTYSVGNPAQESPRRKGQAAQTN